MEIHHFSGVHRVICLNQKTQNYTTQYIDTAHVWHRGLVGLNPKTTILLKRFSKIKTLKIILLSLFSSVQKSLPTSQVRVQGLQGTKRNR